MTGYPYLEGGGGIAVDAVSVHQPNISHHAMNRESEERERIRVERDHTDGAGPLPAARCLIPALSHSLTFPCHSAPPATDAHREVPPERGSSAVPSARSRSISSLTAARPAAVSQSSRIVVSWSS